MYYKSVSAIAGGGKTAVLLNTFSKGLARCSGSNWVFFPDPNWLCAPGANSGKTVSAIGNVTGTTGAFEGCTSITAVVIPDGVTEIQDNAFYDCTSLETVTIPSSVTLLRNCAFCDCPNLRAVYFKGDAPQQSNYVFDSTENVTMYYQDGTSGWENPWHGRPAEVYIPE